MTDQEELTKDEDNGQFVAGNIWRYKKGFSGHAASYTYKSLRLKIIDYITEQTDNDKRFTWSGLARYCGITRQSLDSYKAGKIGNEGPAISALLDYYRTTMEEQLEERLDSKDYNATGIIFALKNQFSTDWQDKQIVQSEHKQQISVIIDPDSSLGKRLEKANAVTIEQVSTDN